MGFFNSSGNKGFIWKPDGLGGGTTAVFTLKAGSSSITAIPRRISDTGFLVGDVGYWGGRSFAGTDNGTEITIPGTWAQPTIFDVNDYGEFIGTILHPYAYPERLMTFLYSPGHPAFFSEAGPLEISDDGNYLPDFDPYDVVWDDPAANGGEWPNYDGATDGVVTDRASPRQVTVHLENGMIYYGGMIYRGCGVLPGAVNAWGEFAGSYDFTRTYLEEEEWNAKGLFFYDGSYLSEWSQGFNGNFESYGIFSLSDDARVMVGTPFKLWSGPAIVPLANLVPGFSPVDGATNAKLADRGRIFFTTSTTLYLIQPNQDADGDGMPDDWEKYYGLNPSSAADAWEDLDGDGVRNRTEFRYRTNPALMTLPNGQTIDIRPGIDSDGDGIPNVWEWKHRMDPNSATDGFADMDGDGLTNLQEFLLKADPSDPDTDGDGMTDTIELAAGFDITNPDENGNGNNDGYEDFDGDTYINREEAMCGTDPRSAASRPDGTAASVVFGGEVSSAGDPSDHTNSFLATAQIEPGGGIGNRVLLVRSHGFDVQAVRESNYGKQGFLGFLPGSAGGEILPGPIGDDYARQTNFRSRFYLNRLTSEVADESYHLDLTAVGLADPINEITSAYSLITGTRNFTEITTKTGGHYTTEGVESGSVIVRYSTTTTDSGTNGGTSTITFPTNPAQSFYTLGNAREEILSDTITRYAYRDELRESTPGSILTSSFDNSQTFTLSNEYTDAMLLEDLRIECESAPWETSGFLPNPRAYFLWNTSYPLIEHASAEFRDSRYRLISAGTDPIPDGTVVKFIWKEVFLPQQGEGGEMETTWQQTSGTKVASGPHAGKFATPTRELIHPDKPGEIVADYNRNGLTAPAELASLNLGEQPKLIRQLPGTPGNVRTEETINRGMPVSFQVDLADQNNNPMLVATGPGTVRLWEKGKDGKWKDHTLPFHIPAEQAAGLASDSGRYMLQGTYPGSVELKITAGGQDRYVTSLSVRQIDLDVDSDNTGLVDGSEDEEKIESDPQETGNMILGNGASISTENDIPRHPNQLVGLKLKTAGVVSGETVTLIYPDRALKVWKTPPGMTPTGQGDIIESGTPYSLSDLGLVSGSPAVFSIQPLRPGLGHIRISVESGRASDDVWVSIPVDVEDNVFATGLDDVSSTASPSEAGYDPNIWIMAPSGTVDGSTSGAPCSNDTRFLNLLLSDLQLHAAPPAPNLFEVAPSTIPRGGQRGKPGTWPTVNWHGNATSSSDPSGHAPAFTFVSASKAPTPVALPVKVKVMKRRTVKVSVFPVRAKVGGAHVKVPDEAALENKLNEIFGYQINAWFDITYKSETAFDYDSDNNGSLTFPTLDYSGLVTSQNFVDNDSDISLILICGVNYFAPTVRGVVKVFGTTDPTLRRVVVNTTEVYDQVAYPFHPELVMRTIAHEIGHVMLGDGHPNDSDGPAPLAGTDPVPRLMCRGDVAQSGSKLLVKREWDAAEAWLSARPNGDN